MAKFMVSKTDGVRPANNNTKVFVVIEEITSYKATHVKAADKVDAANRVADGQGLRHKSIKMKPRLFVEQVDA